MQKEGETMFAQAHYRVAKKVREVIYLETGYQLHPIFLVGNMSPDFTPKGIRQKHYIEEMLPVLLSHIDDLKDSIEREKKRKVDKQLGEICHFLTDFFTLPHNQRWEFHHSMKPHVQYEREVNRLSKKGWSQLQTEEIIHEPKEWLMKRLYEYDGKGSPMFDLSFSERACVEFIRHMVKTTHMKERIKE